MNKRHPYNNIIERKLEQLPAVNADHLWTDMHSILDKKMPQKKDRRRVIVWWFSRGRGLLLLTVALLFIAGSTLFFLSTNENSTITLNKLSEKEQPNKFTEKIPVKVVHEPKEDLTIASETNQNNNYKISATIVSNNVVDHAINKNFIAEQKIKQPQKYTVEDNLSQSISNTSIDNTDFDIDPVNLGSIHHSLIATDHNKRFSGPQLEPVANKAKRDNVNRNESGFYAGIISGVDLSSIHFQSARTGATKGFIIGYAINNKWSIESGLLWDTKRVYDNGTYFKLPGYTSTSGITIIAANGKSRLYELPVNVKYNIISGNHNLFATAGLSSYLMRSENYDYEYTQNNQPGGHNYLTYKNATKNWFSIANLSIGYTHKLGNNGSIRVEPYLKIPLKNIGTANMPITSTGLNIGFTKSLRR